MKSVLVIGGQGFLGRELVTCLLKLGFNVTVFDQSDKNIISKNAKFVEGDILDKEKLDNEISKCEVIYHLAGISDIEEADLEPFKTIHSNIIGTTNVIEACSKYKNKLMFASTVYVYSQLGSFYRVSKQSSEIILEAYHDKYGLDYTILRYGSLYGRKSQDWNGVKKYIKSIMNNKSVTIAGTGKERREYIHIKDAANLSIDALDSKYSCKAVSITGNQVFTQGELVEIIKEITGKETAVTFDHSQMKRGHYQLTPYHYSPKNATKLTSNEYTDIGQGILEIIEELENFD